MLGARRDGGIARARDQSVAFEHVERLRQHLLRDPPDAVADLRVAAVAFEQRAQNETAPAIADVIEDFARLAGGYKAISGGGEGGRIHRVGLPSLLFCKYFLFVSLRPRLGSCQI